MANRQFDLTGLCVSRILEEQLQQLAPQEAEFLEPRAREAVIRRVLSQIPEERRVRRVFHTLPKVIRIDIAAEHRQYLEQRIRRALHRVIGLAKWETVGSSSFYLALLEGRSHNPVPLD